MRRTNIFAVRFQGSGKRMARIADDCARLWNVLNYRRRQMFFAVRDTETKKFDWDAKQEYNIFKHLVGAATAQQVIRKNDQAWRSYLKLLKLKKEGRLPPHIEKVSPPGYWKDESGNRVPIVIIRNDCYRIQGRTLKLPFGIRGRIYGRPRWQGKQGTLEIRYDKQRRKWYAHQSVRPEPILYPTGDNRAYVDLGIRYILCGYIEGQTQAVGYRGASLLSDWWYWNRRIARTKSELKTVNGRNTSKRLSKLYRIRKQRYRQGICEIVRDFVERCHRAGVREILVGDPGNPREECRRGRRRKKTNAMVNNFWSHRYVMERLKLTAENCGITVQYVDESGTSQVCPWCGSTDIAHRGRRFRCRRCGIEAHRDVVGALNIGLVHGSGGDVNRVMAHPVAVR